jgi:hypothetical protein
VADVSVLVLETRPASAGLRAKNGGNGDMPSSREEVDGATLHRISFGQSGTDSFHARIERERRS